MKQQFIDRSRIELDPVGQFYAATISDACPGTFRVSARLKENVNREALQKAVHDLIRRLPFLGGHLHSGLFRYYNKIHAPPLQIEPERDIPAFGSCHKKGRDRLLRVLYGERSFTIETTHIVCDGRSLARIMTALLARYFELLGATIDKSEIIDCSGTMRDEETENAFARHVSAMQPKEAKDVFIRYAAQNASKPAAYRFGLSRPAASRIISKRFDAAKIKAAAREQGVTVSEFILAHIFKAIAEERKGSGRAEPIAAMLPVDYRTFFPSETLTNFAMGKAILMPETDGFSETLRQIKPQFNEINAAWASAGIVGFAKVTSFLRFIPLPIKKRLLKSMKRSAAAGQTTTFSNLGLVTLPAEIEARLEAFEFAFCPDTEQEPYTFACVTVGGTLVLTAAVGIEGADTADKLMLAVEEQLETKDPDTGKPQPETPQAAVFSLDG